MGKCNRNQYILIQENPFENVVGEMASISSQPQWVKHTSIVPDNATTNLSVQASTAMILISIVWNIQGPLLLTWFNFNPSMDK